MAIKMLLFRPSFVPFSPMRKLRLLPVCILFLAGILYSQARTDADEVLLQADRLAILRAWGPAEPLFAEAERQFAARGDRSNALYAQLGRAKSVEAALGLPYRADEGAKIKFSLITSRFGAGVVERR